MLGSIVEGVRDGCGFNTFEDVIDEVEDGRGFVRATLTLSSQ